jgi:CheY-like chemotaxis protein
MRRKPMARVLIVDDDALFRDLFKHSLEFEGIDVTTADSGREAVEMIMASPPDVVLLDLKMPGVSGYDIIRWVRNDANYAKIRLIVITGQANARSSAEAKMADLFLVKPVPMETIINHIKTMLSENV